MIDLMLNLKTDLTVMIKFQMKMNDSFVLNTINRSVERSKNVTIRDVRQ